MFDQKDQVDEVTDLEEEPEVEADEVVEDETDGEQDEMESDDEGDVEESDDEPEEQGLVVSLDDDEDDEEPTPVIRTLRAKLKEQAKKLKELESKAETKAEESVQLGDKPTLDDFDYDSDKYDDALIQWNEKKRELDAKKQADEEKREAMQKRYDDRLAAYQEAKTSLGANGFEDAEDAVREALSPAQQSIIVANAKQPAILVYALGKNPDMMKELASQDDLASFAYRLGQIEAKMTVTGTKKKPTPEKRLNGRSQAPSSGSKKLEQLRSEAEKTGDYSKVTSYKKQLRSQ